MKGVILIVLFGTICSPPSTLSTKVPIDCNKAKFETTEPWTTAKYNLLADLVASTYSQPDSWYSSISTYGFAKLYGYASCATMAVCGDGYCPPSSTQCNNCLSAASGLLSDACKYSIGGTVQVNNGVQCYMQYEEA